MLCSGLCKSTERAGFSFCQVKVKEGKLKLSTAFKETTTVDKIAFRDRFLKVRIEVLWNLSSQISRCLTWRCLRNSHRNFKQVLEDFVCF